MTARSQPSQELAKNLLLDQALVFLKGRLDPMCPSWEKAVQDPWDKYVQEAQVQLERARIGADHGPTAKIRKMMAEQTKKLEGLLSQAPPKPAEWRVSLSYTVGEVFLKRKKTDSPLEKKADILGQADLTAVFRIPLLNGIHGVPAIIIPEDFLPDSLKATYDYHYQIRLSRAKTEEEKWQVLARPDLTLDVSHVTTTLRYVLAPTPANYQKVLKDVRLIETWVNLEARGSDKGSHYGVITDDKRLHDIVKGQGDVAIYFEP
jgi:hypothetical protein